MIDSNKGAETMEQVDKDVMTHALEAYRQYIRADYQKMYEGQPAGNHPFDVTFKPGRKFIRVITESNGMHRSCHSFIEIETGVIWKSASWKAPALNFPRGSVIDQTFERVSWTGVS